MTPTSDTSFDRVTHGALRTGAVLAVIAIALSTIMAGWQSGIFALVGAVISLGGVREWRRILLAVGVRMDAESADPSLANQPLSVGPMLVLFFFRLFFAVGILYVSLRYLKGSVLALAAGLLVGVLALLIEAVRLLRSWDA